MSPSPISIREVDDIGALKATYLISSPEASAGTPPVTIVDSLQAFSSSIAGLLSSRAVLQGVGVGDATASPTAALLLNVLQESMGRIATILFAHRLECKMYRLAADIFNDSAIVMDCLSPMFPKPMRVGVLSLSSVLRAMCGVAAGSSKASLSAHFARWGNLAELNAKDSSQETVISLMGMLVRPILGFLESISGLILTQQVGSLVVSRVTSTLATWAALILLLTIHITTNYFAVRAVNMTTLNRQRANIVFSTIFDENRTLTPSQAAHQERIFERDGVLRWKASPASLGSCRIGVSFQYMVQLIASSESCTSDGQSIVAALLHLFEREEYILWFNPTRKRGAIVLKTNATAASQLKAWSHALIVAQILRLGEWKSKTGIDQFILQPATRAHGLVLLILRETLTEHSENFDARLERLRNAGWDVDIPSLQTKPGRRFDIRKQE
ncbi:conserved hypothetical protein [Uncinocarpus reesii 1704]|uniref:DUF647 domain-containing protein n=1 Tax=Uncinocarpus reesii (strain UAMH 1704) TaxID=336963 RepID=C4JJW6_UNCRE|nr:uncharacterized protein UREG_01923 [Uncinocarpus reesii 1704]EEP77074.1 conserved hypothetical protein [Uncinocarpus reesii 1704]